MDGVVGGAAEQKEEEAALVRCVERPRDQSVDLRGREKSRQRTVMAGVSTYVYADDSNIYYTDQIFPWLSQSLWGNKLKEWFILFC